MRGCALLPAFVTRVLWHVCSGFVVYVLGWAEVLDAKWLPRLNRIALVSNIVFATLIFVSSVVAAALTGEAAVPRCVCALVCAVHGSRRSLSRCTLLQAPQETLFTVWQGVVRA